MRRSDNQTFSDLCDLANHDPAPAVVIARALVMISRKLERIEQRLDQGKKEFQLIMAIQLDATRPIKITAVGKDAEGNAVDLTGTDLTISAESTSGNFGEVNDAKDTFNPGDAGATGVLRGSVTVGGAVYQASIEVELVAGGLDHLELGFSPAPEE